MLLGLALTPASHAQLRLPARPVPHRTAPVVELPSDTAPAARASAPQAEQAELALPREPLPADVSAVELGAGGDSAPGGLGPGPAASYEDPGARSAASAGFVLAELERLPAEELSGERLARLERALAALGPEGLSAARVALYDEHPPKLLAAARALLRSGAPDDVEVVVQRVAERLPRSVAPALVAAVSELAPVRASPHWLAGLLGHPQSTVRAAAQRLLEDTNAPELLGALLEPLEHGQTDTRLRAVQLVSTVRDPAVLPLLLSRLDDRSSTVASRALASLAVLDDPRVADELLRQAFGLRWILREGAYALLAIAEREDRLVTTILSEQHAGPLLEGLDSSDVFVAGACASALAGIGFRGELDSAEWLDRAVPHRLVRTVSGEDFHNDYSALQPIALRRLELLTGEGFGSDGPRWTRWWTEHAERFRARRAVLKAGPEDAGRLQLAVRPDAGLPAGFLLLGPEADEAVGPAAEGRLELRTVWITATQASELFAVLAEEGVLGSQRLPGLRGDAALGTRELELAFGPGSKGFRFAAGQGEPWFERVLGTADAIRDQGRWQHFLAPPDADRAARKALYELEAGWWQGEPNERARALRLKRLVLEWLDGRKPSERDEGAAELARLDPELLEADDFAHLSGLLRGEYFMGPRARTFLRLALDAGRRTRSGEGATTDATGQLPPERARELVDVLLAGFGPEAAREVGAVMNAAGRELTRELAADPRPFVRAVAAATLASGPSEDDWTALEALLADDDPAVEAATVTALGAHRVEAARTDLLVRARVGSGEVRTAALEAVGRLGGEGAFDALLVGLAERGAPEVGLAAARGLVELADPRAAPLFVSILAQGDEHPAFEPAREGLARLGPAADEALLRVVHTSGHRARREAALILAGRGLPDVASTLMALFTERRDDARLSAELAVLTCVDLRDRPDPVVAWWEWWDGVVHDDSLAWLVAGAERTGVRAPAPGALAGAGTREGALWLHALLEHPAPHLAERARRELGRMLATPLADAVAPLESGSVDPTAPMAASAAASAAGESLGAPPADGPARREWLAGLRERIDARYK